MTRAEDERGAAVSPRRRRRWLFRSIIVVCGLLLLGGAGFVASLALFRERPEIEVPDVGGLDVAEARARLEPLGLAAEVVPGYEPTVPKGLVIRQEPGAGSRVRIGRTVRLLVSSGAEPIPVPDVVGLPLIEARNRLERAGLDSFGRGGGFGIEVRSEISDDSKPPGTVLEQDPRAGTALAPGETVWVVLSSGPAGYGKVLPDVRGQTLAAAEALLDSVGVRAFEAVEVPVDPAREGMVVGQEPPPGTPVGEVKTVRLEVGVGVAAEEARQATIFYAVPAGAEPATVVLTVEDDRGTKEVYRGQPAPGSQVSVPVRVVGNAWARLYVDGTLKDGWPL